MENVAKNLCFQSAINNRAWITAPRGTVTPHPVVEVRGARYQLQRGSGDLVAAHCSPGQVFVNARPLTTYIPPTHSLMQWALQGLFGATDVVPRALNEADSRSERWLKPALAQGSIVMLAPGLRLGAPDRLDRDAVRRVFERYRANAIDAHQRAADGVVMKLNAPGTAPDEQSLLQQLDALHKYKEIAQEYQPEQFHDNMLDVFDASCTED
jgi:hypothetical protein